MPEEQTHKSNSKSLSDVLVQKKASTSSYSSGASDQSLFYVPEVEFASGSGHDSGVDSPRNSENQPLLGRMQGDSSFNIFPGG